VTPERLRAILPFAALFVFAGILVAWLIASARIPESADQAVVALMARHILEGHGHPVFFWGSTYGGTLESHLLVPVFAVLGATPAAFRAFYVFLYALFLAGTAAFTARFFGRRAGLASAAFLALPPFFLPYKLLTSDGAYASIALLSLAALALAFEADARLASGASAGPALAALGLVAGVGLWVSPVTLPVPALALAWLALRPGPRPKAAALAAIAGAGILGALPTLIWNVRHGWGSLTARELSPIAASGVAANLWGFLSATLPVFLGAARPHFTDDAHASFPGARAVVPLVTLALLAPALSAARADRRLRLLFAVIAALGVATVFSGRLTPSEPRYLVGAYAALVALLGISVSLAPPGPRRAAATAGMAVLLASDLSGAFQGRRHLEDRDDSQVTGPLGPLVASLERLGATRVYANYWTAYRVTFESGGAVLATPIAKEDGTRNLEWDAAVRAAKGPAIVLLPPRDLCFRRALVEEGAAFTETRVGAFRIFSGLSAGVRDLVGRAAALPMPRSAYRVAWSAVTLPARLAPGETFHASARAANEGPCTWMNDVRLVATWAGPVAREETFATPDRRTEPGDVAPLSFVLTAPAEPGNYTLGLDLEQEAITRFSAEGGATAEARVRVAPR